MFLISCANLTPLPEPIAPGVDVVIVDERPEEVDYWRDKRGHAPWSILWIPLVPYRTNEDSYYLSKSFAPDIQRELSRLNFFEYVEGTGAQKRRETPLELRITLQATQCGSLDTTYGLGFAGYFFYLLGAPCDYAKSYTAMKLECRNRNGGIVFKNEVSYSDTRAKSSYDGTVSCGLHHSIEGALQKALQKAEPVLREKFTQ